MAQVEVADGSVSDGRSTDSRCYHDLTGKRSSERIRTRREPGPGRNSGARRGGSKRERWISSGG